MMKNENDKLVKEIDDQDTNIGELDDQMLEEGKEKTLLTNAFITNYGEIMTKYNLKIDRIKEQFPKNSDYKEIIENSKVELLKLKDKFEDFISVKSTQIKNKIDEKMDVESRLISVEEKLLFHDDDKESSKTKDRTIESSKIRSEIRDSFFEIKEEEEKGDGYSSEEDKNNENTKENI